MSSFENNKKAETIEFTTKKERLDTIKKVITEVKRHFIPFNDLVKIPASLKYPDYNLMWNRDAAYSSYYITEFTGNVKKSPLYELLKEDINDLETLNGKLITTLWENLDSEIKKIRMNGYEKDISKVDSKIGDNHILSRFDVDENGVKRAENDKKEGKTTRSWTIQYDSAPMVVIATERYIQEHSTEKLKNANKKIIKNLDFLVNYMNNFHETPCADAWEQYYFYERDNTLTGQNYIGKTIDAYSVSSIYKGIKSAKQLAKTLDIKITDIEESNIANFLLNNLTVNDEKRGTFLAKSKIEYGETMPSVGAEEVEIFSMFKPEGVEQLEKNTIKVIEKELFNGNYLPIRYKFFGKYRNIIDNYFQRGSWFHLGLQYAMYLIKKGEKEPAENIINYVETRIGDDGSLPEQEIYDEYKVNDPNGFFEKNGNSTIKCLLWAETAYLAAVSNFIN
ncbi:MAG: hypothetical protein BJBARM4_0469 [Candidatus Parvarchaeum acidiphilum ARMAN-4]|jgi:GH15 family glucan-1,4-alpha-glucosidase|uniref:Glucan 1,4-alpha-glucosidase n=1 Tax=Candidatus Parvarchaeum acidiphilum ARMAN-4 TaxID=662760 RepID=D2EFF1_PARA4|nr:MAG: hypothetical protein BJBARM4_0469 [Candidatus Parvarchaeum acidiphilum ARMAN-4]